MFMTPEKVLKDIPLTFEESKNWIPIPVLNYMPLHELKDRAIVRFRGMIQDMQDREIYFERYEVTDENGSKRIQEGKYHDCFLLKKNERVIHESGFNIKGERRTLVVVSVPGLNTWASNYEEKSNRENMARCITHAGVNVTDEVLSSNVHNDIDETKLEANTYNIFRKGTTTNSVLNNICVESEHLLSSPIRERPGKTCMVKIYTDFDSCTRNAVVEFVGFLSIDPAETAETMNDNELENPVGNVNELRPTPSLVPRMHAISFRRLLHLNPLLDSKLTNKLDTNPADLNMLSVQKELRMLLTLCLFNDELAADYLLSHLISKVYNRSDWGSVEKFTLNICSIPQVADYTRKLYGIIELLLPASHYLALSLANMNTTSFAPKRDYRTRRLQSGVLQLAPQTNLVLDETQMQEGELGLNGVKGIRSLAYLIEHQKVKYNYQFYEIEYSADIAVLVLNEGRSMLPSDFTVPLNYDQDDKQHITETLKAAYHYLQPERLDKFRRYLTRAKTSEFEKNTEDNDMIKADFVEMSKMDSSFSSADLDALLVLSRLLAVARGNKVIDKDSWIMAKEMEAKRKERVRKLLLK